jgi:hypothetical protein
MFFTRYFVLYFGVTLVFVRAAISDPPRVSIQATRSPGPIGDVKREEPCTNALMH